MKDYKIVSVLWEDHTVYSARTLPKKLRGLIRPSLTIGFLYKQTKRYIVVASHVERYDHTDDVDFTVILRGSILGIKEYGTVTINNLRNEGR